MANKEIEILPVTAPVEDIQADLADILLSYAVDQECINEIHEYIKRHTLHVS